ncbi:hypothetical protein TNCV_4486131 [Trichonephila clavipes]|nr:hypothetical protein TNCV_4486131 [Trichonephila clavipes]
MQISAKEVKDVSGHSDIPVAIDGKWQKHGHTSLNDAVITTNVYTGKVIDASILSIFCNWSNKIHNENYAYPQHGLCPTNEDTWCEYTRAITTGEVYKHKNPLPPEVLYCIKNVYRELSAPNLLAKFFHGILEAIASNNQVNITKCHILATLGIFPGFYTARAMGTADRERLRKANYDILQNSKEARVKKGIRNAY